jgi:hypothetical protein
MNNLYPIVFILQGYCVYHAYQNQKEYHWYLIILFLPIIGSLIYLYINFGSKLNLDNVGESIKGVVNNNYEVDKLINESKYSDTISNRIKLADTYASKSNYKAAISLYESCLQGFNSDDLKTKEKLLVAKYFTEDYDGVLELGDTLNDLPIFKNSESRIVYAWSLAFRNNLEKAEEVFKGMVANFSNYVHRYEYAKFLIEQKRSFEAKEMLLELEDEISHMESGEQSRKKPIRTEINNLLRSLN